MDNKALNHTLHTGSAARIDFFTLIAIAAVVQLLSTVIHEIIGHTLAAVIVGADIHHFSSVDVALDHEGLTAASSRLVSSAGIGMNVIIGLGVIMLYRYLNHLSSNMRYFLWLLGHVNLFVGGGYLMVLSFTGFGDIGLFVEGLSYVVVWQIGFTLFGVFVSFATLIHGIKTLEPFLGHSRRGQRGKVLTLFPYFTAGIISVISGLFNPTGSLLVATSAAASSFGGQAFLAWMSSFTERKTPDPTVATITVTRSYMWICLAIIAVIVNVAVLGPGLPR